MGRIHGDSRPRRRGITVKRLRGVFYGLEGVDPHMTIAEGTRRMFTYQLARADDAPLLRIGRGATVARPEVETYGRAIFAKALYDLVPATTARLASPDALEVERTYQTAHDEALHATASEPALENLPYSLDVLCDFSTSFAAALDAKWEVVEAWQRDFRLSDEWLAKLAWDTMRTAREMQEVGLEHRGPLGTGYPLSWTYPDYKDDASAASREVVFEGSLPVFPIFVEDLKFSPDEAGFDMYDPRSEDVDDATKRLLNALQPRVRRALEAVAAEEREITGSLAPVAYRTPRAFEWLVRYQVLREDMDEIAEAVGVSTQAVQRHIHKAKNTIGLNLRERSKPGPKPGTTPNRVR